MTEIILNKDNFEQEVLQSDVPVIVDFWAPWCGPCQAMSAVIARLAEESDGSYKVAKLNVDDEEELGDRYDVMNIPNIKVFKGGQVVATDVGLMSRERILQMLQ